MIKPALQIVLQLLCTIFLAFIHHFAYSEEFDTVCKPGRNQTVTCKTRTVDHPTPDVTAQFQQPFSHILVLNNNEAILFPRIPTYNCSDMRNHVFMEMMQQTENKESVIYQTMLCVTVTGFLYPQDTFSDTYKKFAFDLQYTHDDHGHTETILTIETNPGWFRCGKEAKKRLLAGHMYACYKTRQPFTQTRIVSQ